MVIASKHNQNDAVFATSKTALSNYFGTAKISIHMQVSYTMDGKFQFDACMELLIVQEAWFCWQL